MKQSVVSRGKRAAKDKATTSMSVEGRNSAIPRLSAADEPLGEWDALMQSMDKRLDRIHARLDAILEDQAGKRA